ncbi:protein AHNAK2 [Numida meleagris]|uniref:protein AHNAK2 n=1 Tax=Numida meleagris TaxID=8996 RepID=UPI000B3D90C2|nr:protein AHNAK2 [Numida meleagris]
MEVTLKTEVEAGASGFSVTGGGNEGIFIKKVLKESPASKVFSLREGDQLLSATIFFDNIKYEDALKILQYSEPYRVQFSLKRKIAGKDELEHFHSTAQYKKERLSQDKELSESIPEETVHVSGKATSEEDRETLIVNQRVGRSKRPKKDRLSWPKFQSIKNKKMLGHRRSHSTSDAYEPAIQDISPTSTDTESQQEIHIKQKKGSQKKLKFPSIGFKMHRSKTEHQDKQKKEMNTTLLYERQKIHKEDISLEGPEILTVEYAASPASEMKTQELQETLTKDLKDVENGIPTYAKKCPEVEISIKKEKEKESTLKITAPEIQDIARKVSKPSLEADRKETPTKQTPKTSSKSRKKKQKGTEEKTEGENGIKVDILAHSPKECIEERGLEIGTSRAEIQSLETKETREKQAEDDKPIPTREMHRSDRSANIEITMKKGEKDDGKESRQRLPKFKLPTFSWGTTKDETVKTEYQLSDKAPKVEVDVSVPKVDASLPEAEVKAGAADVSISGPDIKLPSVEGSLDLQAPKVDLKAPSAEGSLDGDELESAGLKGKFKMPKFDKPKFGVSMPKAEGPEGEVGLPTAEVELPSGTVTVAGEGPSLDLKADVAGAKTEGAGWKLEKPSLKMPKADIFGWSSSREAKGTVAADVDVSLKEPQVTAPSGTAEVDVTLLGAEMESPDIVVTSGLSSFKDESTGKSKVSLFSMPKVSLSRSSKLQFPSKSSIECSESETICYSLTEESPAVISGSAGNKLFPDIKGDSSSKSSKFRIPSLGFSKVDISSSEVDQDSPLSKGDVTLTKYQLNVAESESKISSSGDTNMSLTDFEILNEEDSSELGIMKPGGVKPGSVKMPHAELSVGDTEYTVKMPKFRKPKFGISWSKGKPSESDIGSKVESDFSKGKITSEVFDVENPSLIPEPELGLKMKKPLPEFVMGASNLDVCLPSPEVTMPKLEMDIHGPECKKEQELISGEKDNEEKESKFKMSKFKLLSFSRSPKKEAIVPSEAEGHLEESTVSVLSGDTESKLALITPENQELHVELDTAAEKDGEKGKTKKSQFIMPKISLAKVKGQKVQGSLPVLETDVCDLKQEKCGDTSVQISDKVSSEERAEMGLKVPKVRVPTLEFSRPEVKGPKIEMGISMPAGADILPACEQDGLTLKSAADDIPSSDIKMITEGSIEVKSPETSVERISSEIAESGVEIKAEGPEGKTKMSKFQMPKFGMTHSKGKGSEKEVSQTKLEAKVPQLKARIEIADIAVEAPNLEVECGEGKESSSSKLKITKADKKASEADIHFPSGNISISKTDSDIQDSDMALKIKEETKRENEDGEEKEGHFKMPKFKLPSFSWSPKKEAIVKADSGANLEENKVTVMSGGIDTEVEGTVTDDQGPRPALDLEISAGKDQQKSPIKKPQFVMPKISLSKIKIPKSQGHSSKVEAGSTVTKPEGDGDDSIQIPDIERSHSKRTEEGAQISIKTAAVQIPTLEVFKTEDFQADMGVSSEKTDAALTASEESFQQVVLKSGSDEDSIQKTGIEFSKGETSIELGSTEIATERSLVMDGRKKKLEGLDGQIKMPKFHKPKFGISLTKGKGPEPEISSPKLEAELPQLKMTAESADIAVRVPASELSSDMSDPGLEVYASKAKTPQVLTAVIEVPKVDISPHSESKPMTEGDTESLEKKEIKSEEEIKAEEAQTEEHQGWFKMPKFRIPAFGRTSLKEKKGDADVERSLEKPQASIPSAKVQTEASIPVAEITIGKERIPKLGDSVESSVISLPKAEGDISLSAERDIRVNIPKPETYADIVKRGAEGQKIHSSEFTVSSVGLPKTELSASIIDKDNSSPSKFSMSTSTLQEQKVKSQDTDIPKAESSTELKTLSAEFKTSSGEITLDRTQEKIDASLPKGELDLQSQGAVIKTVKIRTSEMKIIGKSSELKWPTGEWATAKGSEDAGFVAAKMEDIKVEVPEVKTDVEIVRVDPEMQCQVKRVEKDMSANVEAQVEDRAETSKIKTYKFKIPKFGVLRSEVKGFEDGISLTKSGAVSVSETEIGRVEIQIQKSEGSIGPTSPTLDHMESSARVTVETVDKSQDGPEVNIKIPKLKIPRFTFKVLPSEVDVSLSKVITDPKGTSADIEVVHLPTSSTIPEEMPETLEGDIQKAKSKILTLTEPDIKTAQMTTTIDSCLSNARQDIHWSYVEGQEVSEKVEPEHVAIERCEIYSSQIVKESEILSSEVKTATLGFSLLKVKLPESHSNLEVLAQQSPSMENASVNKSEHSDESFAVTAQRTGNAELKLSDKPHSETEESSGMIGLPKLKTFAAEVKPSSKPEESHPKAPEKITAAPLSKDEDIAEAQEDEEKYVTNEKEKADSKRSPGRFKFWLPSIGFSSSGDETSSDSKTEVKKSEETRPEDTKPADISDSDSSKQTEKTGWFRFPKLGFTSPSKKAKTVDKEETSHKERRMSDADSPSDKPDVFFDAQESLSPKEIADSEKQEIDGTSSNVPVSQTIVTSSARTELILLEEEKASEPSIPGDTTK